VLKTLLGKIGRKAKLRKESNVAEEKVMLGQAEAVVAPRRGRPPKKRGPGRPKGSGKKKPGRPKGSKKRRGPGRPKGSGKLKPGRPKATKKRGPGRPKGSVKGKPGRPKGSGRKAGKAGVSAAEARRIARAAVKSFRVKLPGIIRREIKKLF
jgi:hypothetical protein